MLSPHLFYLLTHVGASPCGLACLFLGICEYKDAFLQDSHFCVCKSYHTWYILKTVTNLRLMTIEYLTYIMHI